ncbi:MAG: GIY-YIG nuclease family protein [Saprospiraceae bacterium]
MNNKIETYLANLEIKLLEGKRQLFSFTKEWKESFDTSAGVYLIREEGKICYVGETGSLRQRMKDLLDTRNHSLRRTVGNKRFVDLEDYKQGTASKKFPPRLEAELNKIFEDNFEVTTIVVKIGRKELEERLVEKYQPIYNKRGKRKSVTTTITTKAYSVEKIRENHHNAYRPWTTEEEDNLIELHNDGYSAYEIGEVLGRKKGAITSRLKKIRERNGIDN